MSRIRSNIYIVLGLMLWLCSGLSQHATASSMETCYSAVAMLPTPYKVELHILRLGSSKMWDTVFYVRFVKLASKHEMRRRNWNEIALTGPDTTTIYFGHDDLKSKLSGYRAFGREFRYWTIKALEIDNDYCVVHLHHWSGQGSLNVVLRSDKAPELNTETLSLDSASLHLVSYATPNAPEGSSIMTVVDPGSGPEFVLPAWQPRIQLSPKDTLALLEINSSQAAFSFRDVLQALEEKSPKSSMSCESITLAVLSTCRQADYDYSFMYAERSDSAYQRVPAVILVRTAHASASHAVLECLWSAACNKLKPAKQGYSVEDALAAIRRHWDVDPRYYFHVCALNNNQEEQHSDSILISFREPKNALHRLSLTQE